MQTDNPYYICVGNLSSLQVLFLTQNKPSDLVSSLVVFGSRKIGGREIVSAPWNKFRNAGCLYQMNLSLSGIRIPRKE